LGWDKPLEPEFLIFMETKKQKYKILNGTHRHDGTNLTKGQIVESERDLVDAFGAEKFELVGGSAPEPTVEKKESTPAPVQFDEPTPAKPAKGKYRVTKKA
jgi:hypothetical protein